MQCFRIQTEQLPARNVCLSARSLVTQASSVCTDNKQCGGEGLTCTVPVLDAGEHIVKLQLMNGSFLLFRGPLAHLWHSSPYSFRLLIPLPFRYP